MYGGGLNKCVQLPQILSQTSTSAQIYITWATDSAGYYGSVTWLAIGKQQWGYASNSDITFPVAFSNKNYVLVITNQANLEEALYHWDIYYQSKTTSKCTFPTKYPKYFIGIGL